MSEGSLLDVDRSGESATAKRKERSSKTRSQRFLTVGHRPHLVPCSTLSWAVASCFFFCAVIWIVRSDVHPMQGQRHPSDCRRRRRRGQRRPTAGRALIGCCARAHDRASGGHSRESGEENESESDCDDETEQSSSKRITRRDQWTGTCSVCRCPLPLPLCSVCWITHVSLSVRSIAVSSVPSLPTVSAVSVVPAVSAVPAISVVVSAAASVSVALAAASTVVLTGASIVASIHLASVAIAAASVASASIEEASSASLTRGAGLVRSGRQLNADATTVDLLIIARGN